jgi:hypothetical protein
VVSARRSPVSARRSLVSVITIPVSSRSPRNGGIASRQDNAAAESVPPMLENGGVRPVLTRLGAALCPWESSAGPRSALHLSSRVYPCFVILLEDCRLLEDCQFHESAHIMPTSMYRTLLDALSVYTYWVAPRSGGNSEPASGSVRFR